MLKQSDFRIGDPVSYQVAGLSKPEYGYVSGFPQLEHGLFVRYGSEQRGKFTDLRDIKKNHVSSWWYQDENGKWWSEDYYAKAR